MQTIVEYHGQNCYFPTSGHCYIKCIKYFTNKGYTEDFSTFIPTEQKRSIVMTSATIQPFCRNYNINIGCSDGTGRNPRNLTHTNISLFSYNNLFCLTWNNNILVPIK